jgi:hypothetical protein
MDADFNANDMGLTMYNNYNDNLANISYNIYKPFWVLREMKNTLTLSNQNNFTTHKPQELRLIYNTFLTTMNYLSFWGETGHFLIETYDYYEPRTAGRYYIKPKATWVDLGFSSDYRKLFALDGELSAYYSSRDESKGYSVELSPIFRLNNHFTFRLSLEYEKNLNDYGYADKQDNAIIFGNRELNTFENSLSGKYLFKNNLSLSLTARHYYKQGVYSSFYSLLDNGYLQPEPGYTENHDFIFNSFNVDMIFEWIFAPGSSLNFVWKNEIISDQENVAGNYFHDFNDTFLEPQLNSISIKALYYIDYQRLTSNKKQKKK